MFAKPQSEHAWYNSLLGNWEFEHECVSGPDLPPTKSRGKLKATSMGGLWFLLDCSGDAPDGTPWTSQFTLGFDPARGKFVGTFIASMMTHSGSTKENSNQTAEHSSWTLKARDSMARVRLISDCFEVVNQDHWILRSRIKGDDGQWIPFMEGHHHRID